MRKDYIAYEKIAVVIVGTTFIANRMYTYSTTKNLVTPDIPQNLKYNSNAT